MLNRIFGRFAVLSLLTLGVGCGGTELEDVPQTVGGAVGNPYHLPRQGIPLPVVQLDVHRVVQDHPHLAPVTVSLQREPVTRLHGDHLDGHTLVVNQLAVVQVVDFQAMLELM